jgi:hypothetical protein
MTEIENGSPSSFGSDRLRFHPSFRPRPKPCDHHGYREQEDSDSQSQLDSGVALVSHGSTSLSDIRPPSKS